MVGSYASDSTVWNNRDSWWGKDVYVWRDGEMRWWDEMARWDGRAHKNESDCNDGWMEMALATYTEGKTDNNNNCEWRSIWDNYRAPLSTLRCIHLASKRRMTIYSRYWERSNEQQSVSYTRTAEEDMYIGSWGMVHSSQYFCCFSISTISACYEELGIRLLILYSCHLNLE